MKLIDALQVIGGARGAALPPQHFHLACGFTPLHLQTFLAAHLQQRTPGARVIVETGVFGDLAGNLERARAAAPAGAVVAVEWSDLDARLGLRVAGGWSPAALPDMLASVRAALQRIELGVVALARSVPTAVAFPTLPLPPVSYTAGWQAGSFELELRAAVAESGVRVGAIPRVRVLNAQRLDLLSPLAGRGDPKTELATGFPYKQSHADAIAALLADLLRGPAPKKGLVTDLDDTLWRGILGEVGVAGVSWDLEHHTQVHGLYQQLLASLAEAGVLVAVGSKNDAALVEEAMRRDDMLLKPAQVFPVFAHWKPKSDSVTSILESWNIGADSVVFVDDSPMELAEVQARHPQVECLLFPKDDPAAVVELLARLRDAFGKPALLEEDRLRLESLRSAGAAAELLTSSGEGTEDFLSRAEAVVVLDYRKDPADARAFELLNKTNQFNLNGRRLAEAEWLALLGRDDSFALTVSYRDKFGALGKIAVLAGTIDGAAVTVESWVMSCRAFARRIEHQCLRSLFERYDAAEVRFAYRPTERNGPTREFLAEFFDMQEAPAELRLARADFAARCRPTYHTVQQLDLQETAHG